MGGSNRWASGIVLSASRPCITCGHPFITGRFPTEELARYGWVPRQAGTLSPPCGHPQRVVPEPAPGVPGWWTLIPLLGQGMAPSASTPSPGFDCWLVKPGDEAALADDPELQGIMTALVAERDAIQHLADEDACRLCGQRVTLTDEHAPSQAAGNAGIVLGSSIDAIASHTSRSLVWTADRPARDGATVKTLCARCNNNTGRRYNTAYTGLVEATKPFATPDRAGQWCEVAVPNLPLIAKQALTWLIATSQPGLTARYPHLRALLGKTSVREPLAPLRLWCHIMANRVGIFTGIMAHVDRRQRAGQLVASFAWWPLGWVLTTGNMPVKGVADASSWVELRKHTHKMPVRLPVQWRCTMYPEDFRTPERVLRDAEPRHQGRGRLR